MRKYVLLLVLTGIMISCSKDVNPIVGEWDLVSTSGAIHGGGIDLQYKVLVIEDDLSFQCVSNNDIIASGQIIEGNNPDYDYFIELDFLTLDYSGYFELSEDNVKAVLFDDQSMDFMAPCCDRINSHFEKK